MGTVIKSTVFEQPLGAGPVVYPSSVKSEWVTIHANATAAAQGASVLLRPATYSDSNCYPIRIPDGAVGFKVRARMLNDVSVVTTSPVVRFYGVTGAAPTDAGVFADDGTVYFERVDNSSASAAGLTLTLVATNTKLRDTTYGYSNLLPTSGRYDLRGCKWLLALIETASAVTSATSTAVQIQVQFVN